MESSLPGEATKPVERAIEARGPQEDALGSMVRCLYMGSSYVVSQQFLTSSLWAGTNQGIINKIKKSRNLLFGIFKAPSFR